MEVDSSTPKGNISSPHKVCQKCENLFSFRTRVIEDFLQQQFGDDFKSFVREQKRECGNGNETMTSEETPTLIIEKDSTESQKSSNGLQTQPGPGFLMISGSTNFLPTDVESLENKMNRLDDELGVSWKVPAEVETKSPSAILPNHFNSADKMSGSATDSDSVVGLSGSGDENEIDQSSGHIDYGSAVTGGNNDDTSVPPLPTLETCLEARSKLVCENGASTEVEFPDKALAHAKTSEVESSQPTEKVVIAPVTITSAPLTGLSIQEPSHSKRPRKKFFYCAICEEGFDSSEKLQDHEAHHYVDYDSDLDKPVDPEKSTVEKVSQKQERPSGNCLISSTPEPIFRNVLTSQTKSITICLKRCDQEPEAFKLQSESISTKDKSVQETMTLVRRRKRTKKFARKKFRSPQVPCVLCHRLLGEKYLAIHMNRCKAIKSKTDSNVSAKKNQQTKGRFTLKPGVLGSNMLVAQNNTALEIPKSEAVQREMVSFNQLLNSVVGTGESGNDLPIGTKCPYNDCELSVGNTLTQFSEHMRLHRQYNNGNGFKCTDSDCLLVFSSKLAMITHSVVSH